MDEGVERNHDQGVAARQPKRRHVGLVQLGIESQSRCLLAQTRQHAGEEVQSINIHAGFQTRQHDPAGPATHVENGTACASHQFQIKGDAVIEFSHDEIVKRAVVEGSCFSGEWGLHRRQCWLDSMLRISVSATFNVTVRNESKNVFP